MEKIKIQDLINKKIMRNKNFNELEWHDAILKKIIIDKDDNINSDTIEMYIIWPSGIENKLIFKDVYYANLSLNFGIIGEDTIREASLIESSDNDIINVKRVWEKHYEGINKIKGFKILTNSTASTIKIFSLSYLIE